MTTIWLLLLTIPSSIGSEILLDASDFPTATKSLAFVDKTRFIKAFADGLEHHVLITCPNGFGKTVNMDMIKRFMEIVVDKTGKPIDRKTTDNYKLFTSFDLNLEIAEDRTFFDENFGKYPVLYLNFNDTGDNKSTKVQHRIGEAIRRAYIEHKWLLQGVLTKGRYFSETEKFQQFLDKGIKEEKEILQSIKILTMLMEDHFGKTVVVLIDEYDTPIMRSLELGANIRKIHQLFDKLLYMLLAKVPHIGRVLFTGVFRMARAEESSCIDNIVHYGFLDEHKYTAYCGFTREAVAAINDKLNTTNNNPLNKVQFRQIDKYYNSYNTRTDMTPIYNPYDILHYFARRKINNYWTKHTLIYGHEAFYKVPDIKRKLLALLWDKEIEIELIFNTTIKDLEDFMKIGKGNFTSPKPRHTRLFFTYLFEIGYLSYTCTENVFELPNHDTENELVVRFQNNAETVQTEQLTTVVNAEVTRHRT